MSQGEFVSIYVFKFIGLLRQNKHRVMKMSEIAENLGLKQSSIRAVGVYKKKAEMMGYKIKTYHGYSGGYQLEEEYLSLTELEEIKLMLSPELYNKIKKINERF